MDRTQSSVAKQAFAPGHEPAEGTMAVLVQLQEQLAGVLPALLLLGLLLGVVSILRQKLLGRQRRQAALRRAMAEAALLRRIADEAEQQARERLRRGYAAPTRPGWDCQS